MTTTELHENEIAELRNEIAGLKNQIAGLTDNFAHRQQGMWTEIEKLSNMIPHKVIFHAEFPLEYKKTEAQLFHNQPQKTGKRGGNHRSEWLLKLCFWTHNTDLNMYPDGTMLPFWFTMRSPDKVEPAGPRSLLALSLQNGMELVGCRGYKGLGKGKDAEGTKLIENQVAAIFPSQSQGRYPARALSIASQGWGHAITFIEPLIMSAEDSKPGTPVEKWTILQQPE